MDHEITCKKCKGTGKIKLADTLSEVMAVMPRRGHSLDLASIRDRLARNGARPMSSASLSARLDKLVKHGLLHRVEHGPWLIWERG